MVLHISTRRDITTLSIWSHLFTLLIITIPLIRNAWADYVFFSESESNKIYRYNISNILQIDNATEIGNPGLITPLGMDIDPVERKIYTTNSQTGTILRINFDGTGNEVVRKLNPLNSLTSGVSIDPAARLLYYGDSGTDTINVMRLDGLFHKELFNENTTKIKALQVAPALGLLFWTDWGHSAKIERAYMDGSNRGAIIDKNIVMPWSLAIDQIDLKLYWGDAKLKRIEVANLDGTNRQVVLETKVIYPFGLTVYDDHLIWSDWSQSKILALKKSEREAHHVIDPIDRLFDKLGDVKIYRDSEVQELKTHICALNNGGCAQLCLPLPGNSRTCACQDGSSLMADSVSCEGYKPLEEFLLVSDTYQGKIMVMDLAKSDRHFYLPILDLKRPDAVDYDHVNQFVYWIEEVTKVIRRIHLNPTSAVNGRAMRFLNDLVSNPTGMSIDTLSRLIYYNNAGLKLMAVMDLEGNNHMVLLKDLDEPRAMALDPEDGYIFWTEWGETPSINSAWGDGTNLLTLATDGVSNPTGITVDHKENHIYWCDARLDKIERMNYDGSNRSIIFFGTSIHPYGIAVDYEYIYWSDWTRSNILRSPKFGQYNENLSLGPKVFSRLGTIKVFLRNRTSVANGCAYTNGGCSHLCLPQPGQRHSCRCPDGLTLLSDKQTCSSSHEMYERFLIFADGVLPEIFVMNYDDPKKYHAVPNLNHSRPAALDYDPVERLMYWSDVRDRSIKRAALDGTRFQVLRELVPNISLPDGLTIDSATRLIYYSDTGRNVISVLSFDGTKHKDLITDNLDEPRAIQIDSKKGYMYWTDWGAHAKIEKAYMDGTNRKTLIQDDIVWPNGLSLDKTNQRLYWVDAKRDVLSSCDVDGGNVQVIVTMVRKHPFALAISPDYFFWTDWITSTVRRLPWKNLQNGTATPATAPAPFRPRQLTTSSRSGRSQKRQEPVSSPRRLPISALTSSATTTTLYPSLDDPESETDDGAGGGGRYKSNPNNAPPLRRPFDPPAPTSGSASSDVRPTVAANTASKFLESAAPALASPDEVEDITNPTFSRLLDIHAYVTGPTDADLRSNPCYADNGGCSDLCFPVPDSRGRTCGCSDPPTTTVSLSGVVLFSAPNTLLEDGLTCNASLTCPSRPEPDYLIDVGSVERLACQIGRPKARCEYRCRDGYVKVAGTESRQCLPNGTWSGSPLRCEGKPCQPLPSPSNAIIAKCPGVYGTKCLFKCQQGATYITGDYERTCLQDGSWSGSLLQCQRTFCKYPYIDEENVVVYSCPTSPKPGDICHLKCKPNFLPKLGSESVICQEDGTWSQPLLSCHTMACKETLAPVNAVKVSCYDSNVGSACVHKCADGFNYISGTKSRECLDNGVWSGSDLICSKCQPLHKPTMGILECTVNGKTSVECHVKCDPGAVLVDTGSSPILTCDNEGNWYPEGNTPSCSELILPNDIDVEGKLVVKPSPGSDPMDSCKTHTPEVKNWLNNSPLLLGCSDSDLCDIKDMDVDCNAPSSPPDPAMTYTFKFKSTSPGQGRVANSQGHNVKDDVVINMTAAARSFNQSLRNGQFPSILLDRKRSVNIVPESSAITLIKANCPSGHVNIDDDCAACPIGSMHDDQRAKCVACPVGQYQSMSGQGKCMECPKGMTSSLPGSYECDVKGLAISRKKTNVSSGVALIVFLVLFILIAILIGIFIYYNRRGMKLPSIAKIPLPPKLSGRKNADQQEMTNVPYENF